MGFFYYNRLKINFEILKKGDNLNFYDYHYPLYSSILKCIEIINPSLSEEIHSGNIKRAFIYSNIIFNKKNIKKANKAHIYITSAHKEVLFSIIKGLNLTKQIKINDIIYSIKNIKNEIYELKKITKFNILSPIILRNKDGTTLNEITKEDFEEKVKESIKRITNKLKLSGEFDIRYLGKKLRPKLFNIKGTNIRAFEATSSKDTIEIRGSDLAKIVALYFGIGDKTNFGFGMLGIPKTIGGTDNV